MQQIIKHLNQGELADRWDISVATLERWRSEGIGPVFLKLQGRVLYRLEDIESFEAESLRKSTNERVNAGGAV
ncbi:helix-turn-helix transcriptional regulator [Nitrosomonas supralitoralis]|uniref:Terminase n=1 Tax=Nitrosomonas supralitoralis TaxID=2116706 RepID=A0A2P7NUL0_9PROT|nr:helix-turn-helix domain-containing protein [Nitrosomonas supralitoralis]PSJ17157.1 terminase [Nitrosomonas supralitoralis]